MADQKDSLLTESQPTNSKRNRNLGILAIAVGIMLWVGSLLLVYFLLKPNKSVNVITTDQAPKALGPYQAAKVYNGLAFISGQIGIDPKLDKLVSADIAEQANQALTNLQNIIEASKGKMENVLKCTIYIHNNMTDFSRVNDIYKNFFMKGKQPARATVAVAQLPLKNGEQALVEIDAIVAIV